MADQDFDSDDGYDEDEDTMENVYLTFALGERDYGLEVRHVIEIVGLPPVTSVPDRPAGPATEPQISPPTDTPDVGTSIA